MRRERTRLVTGVAVAAVVLGVVSTLAIAALSGAFPRFGPDALPYPAAPWTPSTGCEVPSLPGTVVGVRVIEMGGMRGGMRGGPDERGWSMGDWSRDGGDAGQAWPPGMGWMDMTISPTQVKAGEVSLRVANLGWRPHELVVLPLAQGQGVGQRPTGPDGKIDEAGSLGEAAARLGVHRNTIAYRVGRLEELGGWDLSDPDLRFALSVATRILRRVD